MGHEAVTVAERVPLAPASDLEVMVQSHEVLAAQMLWLQNLSVFNASAITAALVHIKTRIPAM